MAGLVYMLTVGLGSPYAERYRTAQEAGLGGGIAPAYCSKAINTDRLRQAFLRMSALAM
jgi:hypothetical protein